MIEKPALSEWDKKEIAINITFLILASVSVGSGILAINYFTPLTGFAVFWFSLWFSIPAFCIFTFFIKKFLQGFSETKDTIAMINVVGFVLFLILGWGMISLSNSLFDFKQPQRCLVPILNKYYSHGSTYYSGWSVTVDVKSLGLKEPLTFSIPTSDYKLIEHKDKCTITIKPGFWGYKWLASHSCD